MHNEIEARAKAIVATVLGVEPAAISDRTSSETLAAWTSLNHMKLVLSLEEEFGVVFDEEQILQAVAFPRLVSILQELRAKQ
jgi:acyl carrier protein